MVSAVLEMGRGATCQVAVAGAISVGRAGERLAPIAEMAALDDMWRRGIDACDVLFLVDPGRPSSVSSGISVPAGPERVRQILTDQHRRRRERALPEITERTGWWLAIEGSNTRHELVHEALLTLANGRIGIS